MAMFCISCGTRLRSSGYVNSLVIAFSCSTNTILRAILSSEYTSPPGLRIIQIVPSDTHAFRPVSADSLVTQS